MKIHPIFIICMPLGIPLLLWSYFSKGTTSSKSPPSSVDESNPIFMNTTEPGWSIECLQNLPYDSWPMTSSILREHGNLSLRELIAESSPNMYDAASKGFLGFVQYYAKTDGSERLCEKSGDGQNKRTPVQIAIANQRLNVLQYVATLKHLDLVKCLLDDENFSNSTDEFKNAVFRSAVKSGDLRVLKNLIEKKKAYSIRLDEQDDVNALLKLVGFTNNLSSFQYYREEATRLDVDITRLIQSRLLNRAAMAGRFEVVNFLVDTLKFDVNMGDEFGWTAAHCAAFWGSRAMLEFLVEVKGANVDVTTGIGNTLLHLAVSTHGSVKMIEYLVQDKRMNVNVKNNFDQTPLYYAVWNGRLDIVFFLTAYQKADPFIRDSTNKINLLHLAAYSGHLHVLKYLIVEMKMMALVNETEKSGHTAAMNAARCLIHGNALPILKYLVEENQASTAGVDLRGLDILMIAANETNLSVVRYLVEEKGFDLYKKCIQGDPDYVGKSAYDLLKDVSGVNQDCEWFRAYVKKTKSHSQTMKKIILN